MDFFKSPFSFSLATFFAPSAGARRTGFVSRRASALVASVSTGGSFEVGFFSGGDTTERLGSGTTTKRSYAFCASSTPSGRALGSAAAAAAAARGLAKSFSAEEPVAGGGTAGAARTSCFFLVLAGSAEVSTAFSTGVFSDAFAFAFAFAFGSIGFFRAAVASAGVSAAFCDAASSGAGALLV